MIFIYYPLILISILGYGFFASNKIIKLENYNLGYQGIVGIFSLLIISYTSTQFLAHTEMFNSFILIIGLILFIINIKRINPKKKILNYCRYYFFFLLFLYWLVKIMMIFIIITFHIFLRSLNTHTPLVWEI